jgi:hypothetical protein
VCCVFLAPSVAYGTLIAYDSFQYTGALPFDLNKKGTIGTTWTAAWAANGHADVMDVSADPLTYSDINGGTQAVGNADTANDNTYMNRGFTSQNGTVYVSFLVSVTAGAIDNTDEMRCYLWDSAAWDNGKTPAFGIFGQTAGDEFAASLGVSNNVVRTGGQIVIGTTHLVVARVSKSGGNGDNYDTVKMWLDPTDSETESTSVTTAAYNSGKKSFDVVGIRQNALDGGDRYLIDELTLGTTWGDVVAVTPEPCAVALLAVGASMIVSRKGTRSRLGRADRRGRKA